MVLFHRGLVLAAVALAGLAAAPVRADEPADPVLATVNGKPIHMSDLRDAAQTLPPQAQSMPPQQLYPLLLDQLIDAQALKIQAQKIGLDKEPEVQRAMQAAQDHALESAMIAKTVRPQLTEEAIKAKYDADYAGKQGESEVHARHILVPDEATAKKIIAELKKGGDFAALSKQYSKDPAAAAQGGDLGYFKKSDMVPEFAQVAFTLKDNEISPEPVKTQFGWHVIQVLGHRVDKPPSFEEERDKLRQTMAQAAIQKELETARNAVTVVRFNQDGSPKRPTDNLEPPPAK